MVYTADLDAYFERLVAYGYLDAVTEREKDLFWRIFLRHELEEPEFKYERGGTFKPMMVDLNPMVENNFDEDRDDD